MLDRRERSGEMVEAILVAQEGLQARLWTAMPGIIQDWDPAKRTAVVQPAIQARVSNPDGTEEWATLPLLVDCPVVFPGAGDVVLTFPLKLGDECLVVFASRCIDAWWQSGGIQAQAEMRMHDLSDGYCIPGASSVPRVEGAISTTEAELRTRDGVAKVRINPATHVVTVETTDAELTVSPSIIDATSGNSTLTVTNDECSIASGANKVKVSSSRCDITGTLWINGAQYLAHHHTGVTTGGGNTGGAVP